MSTVTLTPIWNGEVQIAWTGFGRDMKKCYSVRRSGGFVRDEAGNQVCYGLSHTGNTIEADSAEHLLAILRGEAKEDAARSGATYIEAPAE